MVAESQDDQNRVFGCLSVSVGGSREATLFPLAQGAAKRNPGLRKVVAPRLESNRSGGRKPLQIKFQVSLRLSRSRRLSLGSLRFASRNGWPSWSSITWRIYSGSRVLLGERQLNRHRDWSNEEDARQSAYRSSTHCGRPRSMRALKSPSPCQ
jgi:hypothetical protein